MSTNSSSADYGRFEELAEEFAARFRRGERPSLQEYIDRCPDLADEIRELFPALVEVERVKEDHPEPPSVAEVAVALPPLGQVGDYRVLREVGRGGMGVVYEAEQVSLGRRVALKVLPRQVSSDLKTLARFRREARSAAQLHHTNIVPVFEVGKDGEVSYYAMQFIQGQGLDLVIDELQRHKGRAHRTGPVREPEPPDMPIPSGTTAAAPSRPRQVSRMAHSLLTGRFAPETPGGSGEAEATSANKKATAALSHRRDPDETDAPAASDPAVVAGSSPPSSVVLPGASQLSAVESGRRPFFRSVAHIGRQVAAGLAYAHARGIVHRDIKPSNLLLDTQGVVWITDFGLAKASDDGLTQTGDILGTLRYMAPERFRGEGDGRADVYALGLTLYELLTLRPAFNSPDRLKLIEQIKAEEPPRPRALDPRIPRDLETIVLKAIHKDAKDRYPSADALGEDLRRFLANEPIRARRVSVAERFSRWCERNPVVAGLLAAVFVLLAAVTGVTSVGYVQTKRALDGESQQRAVAEAAEVKAKGETQRAQEAEQDFRRQWYAASINLMQPACDTGQVSRLRALLAETESYPERGFEWSYWQRLCHLDQHTLIGHRAEVRSVSWSSDGTRLVTGSIDGTAKVWDAASGRELLNLRGHTSPVFSVSWSPDGTRLATGSRDGTAKVWDAPGGRERFTLKGHVGPVLSVAWSPDGTRLATGTVDGTAKVWDVAGGLVRLTLTGHTGAVWSVSWSPDGMRLATASADGTAKVWDAASGHKLITLEGHAGPVYSVAWSPDGTRMATGSRDGTAKVWDAPGGRERLTLKAHTKEVASVAWSPDGTRLATGCADGTAKVWDVAGGRELLTLKGHNTCTVYSVAWSPDGTRLATGCVDGTAKVWDATGTRERLNLRGHTGRVLSVAWSPDGTRLATASADGTAKVWDAAGGGETLTLPGHTGGGFSVVWAPEMSGALSVSWSPDGTRLATGSGDGAVKVWDAAGGRELLTLKGLAGAAWSVAWSPDGTRLAAGRPKGMASVWEVAGGGEPLTLKGHTGDVVSLSWSPDGTRLATGSRDETVKVWDAAGGRDPITLKGHTRAVFSVSWSPDGSRLATAGDDGAMVWDAAGGQKLLTLEGHTRAVFSVSWSPDGTRLATGSQDGTAKVWDAVGGRELLTLTGHTAAVWSVSWSPDGMRLATGDEDGTAKVWDAAGAEAVREWARQDRAVQELLESNDIYSPHAQGFIQTWLLLLPLPLASGEHGAQALDRQQLPGEAQMRPRPGEQVMVGDRPLQWQEYRSPKAVVNLHAALRRVAERSVAYAVCYIESDQARDGLWLQVGSNDHSKVYVNGREIYRARLPRGNYWVDTVGPVALRRGINVLLFKVVYAPEGGECGARLVDEAGRPAQGLRVKLAP